MVVTGGRTTRRGLLVAAVAMTAALAAACSGGSPSAQQTSANTPTTTTPPPKPVTLSVLPADKATDVPAGEPIAVAAADGKITQVALANADGKAVAGQLTPDGLHWGNTEPLGYGKAYTLTVTGQGTDGKPVSRTSTFTTVTPRTLTALSMNPLDGETVGVGQPLAFYFDEKIADKPAAEKAIQVTTTPKVDGAFYWFNDKEVHWRPKDFWATGTKITVKAAIYGKNLGNGIYGQEDVTSSATIGDAVISEADGATHQMTVKVNGQVVRTMPISMGSPKHPSSDGIYVVTEKRDHMIMDSTTYGLALDQGGYKTPVDWATRISNGGIFVHSAPWSVGQQGNSNVSHGCINASPENAKWYFDLAKKGDIVIGTNTGGPQLDSWDGFGDWQVPWDQWVAGNR
ncbi:L,D-transpeptidase [Solihabitans fulvus]|uniref:L,D-transpeptidase n=1 Tax=Solihabitans fulvus TaxID=1892852 RepID=A0A5B2XCF7_9PSEU|nr:Ig-like domain-containing protein [Solihabitans fulvus]KAA2261297.1 L,D-transpeptidase [Solihabitans fulvus]